MIIKPFFTIATTLVMNCSDEYVPYMDVCLESVKENSSNQNNYDIVVLETSISKKNKNYLTKKYNSNNFRIRFYNPSKILALNLIHDTIPNYSKESFYKIIVPQLFKKYKKVIYADIDIIYQCDITEIQNINIGDSPIGATRDFALIYLTKKDNALKKYLNQTVQYKNLFDYFAAGLLVYDIKKFTENDIPAMLNLAYKNQFWLQEQDLINKYFNGRIFELPYKYCINTAWIDKFTLDFFENDDYAIEFHEAKQNPKVLHYSGETKPWHRIIMDGYEPKWWDVAKRTSYYEFFIDNITRQTNKRQTMENNIYLFIIWEKARHLESEILNRIQNQFTILKKFAIQWDPDKFHDNIYSFGGGCLVNSNFHEYHKGKGEFLMVLVKDEQPNIIEQKTAQDVMFVNKNVFDFKYKTRAELLNNMCSLHVSNNYKETLHDFALLTGKSLNDYIANNELDGQTVYLHQNLPCVDGWHDLAHVFYILNETVDYAVLRNFNGLPDKVIVDEHTDIDILVDDMQNFISVLEGSKLRDDVFKIRVYANVNGQSALFHCKYIGDDYYDRKWQKRILQTRVINENGIYIPNNENYFYSLLYHALYQKTYVSNTYQPIFKKFMNGNTDLPSLKKEMESYLRKNNYKITQPYENLDPELHVADTLLGRDNIDDISLIDNENEYYITRGRNAVSIFNKKLAGIDHRTASRFMFHDEENRFDPFVNFSYRLFKSDDLELKNFKKYIHDDTLFLTFRKRYGKIAISECRGTAQNRTISKKCLGLHFKRKYKLPFMWFHPNEIRFFRSGCTVTDYLKRLDTNGQERMLDIFIGKVFEKFSLKDSDLLNGFAFDMTTDNCIVSEQGELIFFDFEYEYRKSLYKSHVVFRIIEHCGLPCNKKDLYVRFCEKLKLPEMYEYYADLEKGLFCDVTKSPKKSKLFKLLSCLIPIRKKRKEFRKNNQSLDYRRFRKIFGKDSI